MKKTAIIVLFLICMVGNALSVRADSRSVGTVRSLLNEAYILRSDTTRAAEINMAIMNGDLIKTGSKGSLGIVFEDDTIVSMGPDSEFIVENFVFRPAGQELSLVVRILQGTYSFLSGQITKLSPESVRIETPDATIGMRGTHVLIEVKGR